MELKIIIRTPKGQATKTQGKLKRFILGKEKAHNILVSPEDNEIVWQVNVGIRKAMKIQKNVVRYESLVKGIFNNKLMKKKVMPKLEPGQLEELQEMLTNQTSIQIIKTATAQELLDNETYWEKIKRTFKKL